MIQSILLTFIIHLTYLLVYWCSRIFGCLQSPAGPPWPIPLSTLILYVNMKQISLLDMEQTRYNQPHVHLTMMFSLKGICVKPRKFSDSVFFVAFEMLGTDFLKVLFFATKIFVWKFCANKIEQNNPQKLQKIPKKCKTVINCPFPSSNPQILRNLWNFCVTIWSHGRTFRNSGWEVDLRKV